MIFFGSYPMHPGKIIIMPRANPLNLTMGGIKEYAAHVVLKWVRRDRYFKLEKDRFGDKTSAVAAKYFGLNLDAFGYFVDEQDETVFLLKYGGLRDETMVDFPLL
jgi:hypothetical protein